MITPDPRTLSSDPALAADSDCRSVASRKVLIASDSPIAPGLLKALLVKRGHIVEIADSIEKAVSELAASRFDCVLVDLHRLRLEAMRTVNALKEHLAANESKARFIGLSASSGAACDADELGFFDAMIAKPVDVMRLYDVVERIESDGSEMPAEADAAASKVAQGSAELTLNNGAKQACRVIDLSLGGAAIETYPKPAIGAQVKVGRTNGRVIRHTERGVAVEFLLQAHRAV